MVNQSILSFTHISRIMTPMHILTHNSWAHLPALIALSLCSALATTPRDACAEVKARGFGTTAKHHKLVFQVSDDDSRKWNLTLGNARNVQSELGENKVDIEIVVYGPAIDMLRIESEVAPRVDEAIKKGIRLVACENTMRAMNLTSADMLPGLNYVRSGVVYLMRKQEQGYAYVRP
jgi:uncharacterized protein